MPSEHERLKDKVYDAAINPFHGDGAIRKQVMAHIAQCGTCRSKYEEGVRDRKRLGHDPTHIRI